MAGKESEGTTVLSPEEEHEIVQGLLDGTIDPSSSPQAEAIQNLLDWFKENGIPINSDLSNYGFPQHGW